MAVRSNPDVDPAKSNVDNLSPDNNFILPHIQRYSEEPNNNNNEKKKKRRITFAVNEEEAEASTQKDISTVKLPFQEDVNIGGENAFPRRLGTTANGKAHLIGPKNKLDILSDYGKAVKGGLITYDQYMKNLSSLSLHKVTLSNSVERHFHIVR